MDGVRDEDHRLVFATKVLAGAFEPVVRRLGVERSVDDKHRNVRLRPNVGCGLARGPRKGSPTLRHPDGLAIGEERIADAALLELCEVEVWRKELGPSDRVK